MSNKIEKLEKYIVDSFEAQGKYPVSAKHLIRTAYWLKVLQPNASEAQVLAALGHDIERAFRSKSDNVDEKNKKKDYTDSEYLRKHQEESARVVAEFLKAENAEEDTIIEVMHLISKHEVGGDEGQNLIKDADSISFFENNVDHFINKEANLYNKENVKEKFDWMFNRISSEEAIKIAKPWYEDAIKRLENV